MIGRGRTRAGADPCPDQVPDFDRSRQGLWGRLRFTRQVQVLVTVLVIALVLAAFVLFAVILHRNLVRQYEDRALAVAASTAANPGISDDVATQRQSEVQRAAKRVQKHTGALFVVVTDRHGIRMAHPNPHEIGHRVSTDPSAALGGHEVTNLERGTLGLSARGKVPLRHQGRTVGEVSVGFEASEIDARMVRLLVQAAAFLAIALAAGLIGTGLVVRMLKQKTRGIEPEQLTELVRDREAVLHGVREGVLAFDADGRVTTANSAARALLGEPLLAGTPVSDVSLPRRVLDVIRIGEVNNELAVADKRMLVFSFRRVSAADGDLGGVISMRDRTDLQELAGELDSVRSMTDSLRAQRHEYANRMHALTGLLAGGHAREALEYVRGIQAADAPAQEQREEVIASATIRAFMAAKIAVAAERGVELRLSEDSYLATGLKTPVETVTVLGNLTDNAIAAAARTASVPPAVEVDVCADGLDLLLFVADSGPGVPVERAEFVFTSGITESGDGHGLGLATARQTARSLGGDVWVAKAANPGDALPGAVFGARLRDILDPGQAADV